MVRAFCVWFLPNPSSQRFWPRLSPRIFRVLILVFRSMTHFKLIFIHDVKYEWNFIFLNECPIVLALFAKKTIFPPLNDLSTLVKSQSTMRAWIYFRFPFFLQSIYLTLILLPHCLDYCSIIVKQEKEKNNKEQNG